MSIFEIEIASIRKSRSIFEIEIASTFSVFLFGFVYILDFVLCTVWLVVFGIIVRTDGQSCQALIRACA